MSPNPTFRGRALRVALAEAAAGVHEVGGNNRGPMVAAFLASTGIAVPAAWCMALVHWCYLRVGLVLGGGASVGNFAEWGRQHGDLVTRPLRGDVGCWDYSGDGWGDHVFIVVRVLSLGPWGFLLRTVEGNTSSGLAGSQNDGDGIYVRTRRVTRHEMTFVRIPGAPRREQPPRTLYKLVRRLHGSWWMTTVERR